MLGNIAKPQHFILSLLPKSAQSIVTEKLLVIFLVTIKMSFVKHGSAGLEILINRVDAFALTRATIPGYVF